MLRFWRQMTTFCYCLSLLASPDCLGTIATSLFSPLQVVQRKLFPTLQVQLQPFSPRPSGFEALNLNSVTLIFLYLTSTHAFAPHTTPFHHCEEVLRELHPKSPFGTSPAPRCYARRRIFPSFLRSHICLRERGLGTHAFCSVRD